MKLVPENQSNFLRQLALPLALLAMMTILNVSVVRAAAGDLDTTFGANGIVITDNGTAGIDGASDLAAQPDGKIVAVGNSTPDFSTSRAVIIRYDANGAIDTAFGTGGKVFISAVSASAVTLQTDGKILVVGQSGVQNNRDVYVVRLNADGSTDTMFGTNGEIRLDLRGSFERATSVKVQPDGKILVGGSSSPPQGSGSFDDYTILRFNQNGSLDTSFDGDGKVFTVISPNASEVFADEIYIQPNGKIVASGGGVVQINGALVEAGVTVRYNADGSLDTSFDADGIALTQFAPGEAMNRFTASAVAGQCDGKIVVSGFGRNAANSNGNFAVVRLNADGSLDASFGAGGKVSIAFPPAPGSFGIDVAIQADNKIVVAGNANNENFAVARLNSNGSLDTTFSGDGKNLVPSGLGSNVGAVVIQPNGKIVLGGTRSAGNARDFMLARFDASSGTQNCSTTAIINQETRKFDFDGDGRTDVSVVRIINGFCQWYIRRSLDNQFYGLQFGLATDRILPLDFDGDGRTDIAVVRVQNGVISFYILQSLSNSLRAFQFGLAGDDAGISADFDGDGKVDPAVFRAGAQSYFYYLGSLNNPNFNLTSVQWGTSGDLPVRGDFDGDGRADAAVYRSSNGIWYVRQSSNGQLFAVQFGLSTDKPVVGDFDGDGKTDVAVFRLSSGIWYIRQSSDGQIRSAQFGLGTDKLAAGDYDGDGRTDIAVWRDGVYYVLQSTNAQVSAQQFGAPTDTPVASAFVQ